MSESPEMTLTEARSALRDGRTTSLDLVEAALARIQDEDGEGARTFTLVFAEQAREAAKRADALLRAGRGEDMPLLGLPVSIKDLFDVQGHVTTAGSLVLKDQPPAREDAEILKRLQRAGAVIMGRTTMTEFAFSGIGTNPHYGTPRNPFERALGRIPGGSSSGAAISVTDGMAFAGIGTDTGGSVRIPAALSGLAGFKPTQKRVPLDGAYPLSRELDSIGPLARTIDDCIVLDGVLSGEKPDVPQREVAGLRLGVVTNYFLDGADDAVSRAFMNALSRLADAGADLQELQVPAFSRIAEINRIGTFASIEAYQREKERLEKQGHLIDPHIKVRIESGARFDPQAIGEIRKARRIVMEEGNKAAAPFDAMIMPTVPIIAPPIAEVEDDEDYGRANLLVLRNPTAINFIDGCAASVPCHRPGEAPAGLMIAGTHGTDARILAIARAVEALLAPGRD